MSQVADASLTAAPSSPQLKATVERAYGYADEQGHRQVTPEHLLLALTEDADAVAVLQRKGIDLDRLRNDVAGLMGRNNDRFTVDETGQTAYGADFRRVMSIAGGAASPRRPIDGALMLSAMIADGVTPAAELIKLYGLNFEDASRTSRPLRNAAPPAQPAAPPPPSMSVLRTTAREAALGYRMRKEPPEDFVAIEPEGVRQRPDPLGDPVREDRWSPTPDAAPVVQMPVRQPPMQMQPLQPVQQMPLQARAVPHQMTDQWAEEPAELPMHRNALDSYGADPALPDWQPANGSASYGAPPLGNPPDWRQYGGGEPQAQQEAQPPEWSQEPAPPPQQQPPAARQPPPREQGQTRRAAESGTAPKTKGRKAAAKARKPANESSLLIDNIPHQLVSGISMNVEARIARRDLEAALLDLHVPGGPHGPDSPATHAMTVRLRSPDGAVVVETASPETQWVENTLGLLQDDFSSWRWTITPRWSGKTELQLVASARSVTAEGLLGETALTDQTVAVSVVSNYRSGLGSVAKWLGIALAAGIVGAVGEHLLRVVGRILTH
jgi:neural Wiskott-Aldrich syndrome protein